MSSVNKKNVLIFPAGSSMDTYKALKDNIHFNVFGASGKRDHAEYIYPSEKIYISRHLYITDKDCVNEINSLIERWHIDFIIPAHDTIARFLMENEKQINACIICSPYETAAIAENKNLIYRSIKSCNYCPEIYSEGNIKYPAFLKPFIAAGGKGTALIKDEAEMKRAYESRKDFLLCEYLPGKEYTVDCFTDSNRKLLFTGPRIRENITNGISYHAERAELTDEIRSIAEDLNARFVFRGSWFFQLKEDINGRLKLMEFSVRNAGTQTFWRHMGVNFPLLSLFDFMGYKIEIICNDTDISLDRGIENLFRVSYDYDSAYIDYDDTLIVNGHVNTDLMKYIYQCINNGIRVILLTAHEGDLDESMNAHRISRDLFDEIITVMPGVRKSGYIHSSRAVFIDNYFPERLDVSRKLKIPVFDVDAFSCLIK